MAPAAMMAAPRFVEHFFRHPDQRDDIRAAIEHVGDLERLISKVAVGRISPREVVQLRNALSAIAPIKDICENSVQDRRKKCSTTSRRRFIALGSFSGKRIHRRMSRAPMGLTVRSRLVRAGKRVAICEQLEDPKATKKLVKPSSVFGLMFMIFFSVTKLLKSQVSPKFHLYFMR